MEQLQRERMGITEAREALKEVDQEKEENKEE